MFSWKRKNQVEDLVEAIKARVPPPPEKQEHYRVGFDEGTQMVTLTLMGNGTSMTLSMSPLAVDKLKRMLDAAKPIPEEEDEQPD